MLNNFADALAYVLILQWVAMLSLDRMTLRVRAASLLGNSKTVPRFWYGPGCAGTFYGLYWLWMFAYFAADITRPQTIHRSRLSSDSSAIAVVAVLLVAFGFNLFLGFQTRAAAASLETYRVYRGKLADAARSVVSRCGRRLLPFDVALYVLPKENFADLCNSVRWGVALPFEFLDELSRKEINSIVAGQVSRQSQHVYAPVYWAALLLNGVSAYLVYAFHLGLAEAGILLVALASIELISIRLYSPFMQFRAELYSIELGGSPEAYFSARGWLNSIGGEPLRPEMLRRIAAKSNLSEAEMSALLSKQQISEEKDRYPTSGSYLETGL